MTCSATARSARTPRPCTSRTPTARASRASCGSRPRSWPSTSPAAPRPGCRPASTRSATPPSTRCSTRPNSHRSRRGPAGRGRAPARARRTGPRPRGGWPRPAWSPRCSRRSTRPGAARTGCTPQRLGAERAGRLNRFADLAAAGVPLAFGSDAPVTPLGPWAAVRAAVHPHATAAPAISPPAAFAAHTQGGWRAAGRDGDGAGVLRPGAPATFAVWRQPTTQPPRCPTVGPGDELPDACRPSCGASPIFDAGLDAVTENPAAAPARAP